LEEAHRSEGCDDDSRIVPPQRSGEPRGVSSLSLRFSAQPNPEKLHFESFAHENWLHHVLFIVSSPVTSAAKIGHEKCKDVKVSKQHHNERKEQTELAGIATTSREPSKAESGVLYEILDSEADYFLRHNAHSEKPVTFDTLTI
jgi:hypothetical protein